MMQRNGKRKTREQLSKKRVPKLGNYLIITDTEKTEDNYFTGLRDSLPKELQGNLVIQVHKTRTARLIQEAQNKAALATQYAETWIVFDRDRVQGFDSIITTAENMGFRVGWSNPCIEIWFSAYFGVMPKNKDSNSCCRDFEREFFRVVGQEYRKSDQNIYSQLTRYGNEIQAVKIAKQKMAEHTKNRKTKPSDMYPATKLYALVEEIVSVVRKTSG